MRWPAFSSMARVPITGEEFGALLEALEKKGYTKEFCAERLGLQPQVMLREIDFPEIPAWLIMRVVVMLRELDNDDPRQWGRVP